MPIDKILVVGGAGFIGAHMVNYLKQANYQPIVLDNLSTGHLDTIPATEFIAGDLAQTSLLEKIFSQHQFVAVMHFASFIQVGESVLDPLKYYHNNVAATLNLLAVMRQANLKKFIFSSSAAVYGEPRYTPIDEAHPLQPLNPYGRSKWMIEQILQDYAVAYDFQYMALRYFNAAGADPAGQLCERHVPETHLIPLLLQVANGERDAIRVYGQDYPTPDGTCIRDYIHVTDICAAHLLALQALLAGKPSASLNLGTGKGYSVLEVVHAVRDITQHEIPIQYSNRRAGDPAILVADSTRAKHELNWQPRYPDLKTIIQDAWRAYNHCIKDSII